MQTKSSNSPQSAWEIIQDPSAVDIGMAHAALLYKDRAKLLFWGQPNKSRLWDPETNRFQDTENTVRAIFCGAQNFLPDGTLLVNAINDEGDTYQFDLETNTWTLAGQMRLSRYYPSIIALSGGRLMALYGTLLPKNADTSKDAIRRTEQIWSSFQIYENGLWSDPVNLPFNPPSRGFRYYPWTFLFPEGDYFIAGPSFDGTSQRFTWDGRQVVPTGSYSNLCLRDAAFEGGTAVLLPLSPPRYAPTVLIAGGMDDFGGPCRRRFEYIDFSQSPPAWSPINRLSVEKRSVPNAVLMPDGRVLFVGGAVEEIASIDRAVQSQAEIFDPQAPNWHTEEAWVVTPATSVAWNYHSCAILIPDGRIVIGGEAAPNRLEVYRPWYWFVERPVISAPPSPIRYQEEFDIRIESPTNPSDIVQVLLIRPGAVTHSFDMGQRAVYLSFRVSGMNTIKVTAPPHGNVAPPGYYMLFISTRERDGERRRIPSKGMFTRLI